MILKARRRRQAPQGRCSTRTPGRRNGQWRTEAGLRAYLAAASEQVGQWRAAGPALLRPEADLAAPGHPRPPLGDELRRPGGIYLFRDR